MANRFEDYSGGELPWLDRPDARERIEQRVAAGELTNDEEAWLSTWVEKGYVIFPGLLDPTIAERINADVQAIYDAHKHLPIGELKEHFKNAYPDSAATREALIVPELLARLDLILGKRSIPHQTLSLPVSSQQAAHSDQILMTTHPIGYMLAAWFALETIDEECGPLLIYPGSHRLPYVSAKEVGIPTGASAEECGAVYDANYYRMVGELVEREGLEPVEFIPEQGDVLVWHSNLLHGARLIERTGATRKSLIAHYYAEGVEHYSDLFGRPTSSNDLRPAGV